MLFLISFFIFYFSYLFRVLFLILVVILLILVYISSILYLKFLILLVYVRGIVVFILYISCLCWNSHELYSKWFLLFGFFVYYFFDLGLLTKFSDIGQYLWIYLFFSFLFNSLVSLYSLNLFKISGSLRF